MTSMTNDINVKIQWQKEQQKRRKFQYTCLEKKEQH